MSRKRILCVDFDGVIHAYTSKWQGIDVIPDFPVQNKDYNSVDSLVGSMAHENSIEWLNHLIECDLFHVNIYSSRSKEEKGVIAMKTWLYDNGMSTINIGKLFFPTQKPSAFLTIDDRALTFTGRFFDPLELTSFKTWQE